MADPTFTDHLTAYIDILGFRSALRDAHRLERLLALLSSIATARGEFRIDRTVMENGHQTSMRPAISAFSDSIVLSYPMDALKEHEMDIGTTFLLMQSMIGAIAASCIDVGLLVRGGISLGQLYHSNGIVLGPALVEAYELEAKIAYYPRIVVASSLADNHQLFGTTFQDSDGLHCFSYWHNLAIRSVGSRIIVSPNSSITSVRRVIGESLAALREGNNTSQLAKWQWFSNQFEAYVSRLHPQLLEMVIPEEVTRQYAAPPAQQV